MAGVSLRPEGQRGSLRRRFTATLVASLVVALPGLAAAADLVGLRRVDAELVRGFVEPVTAGATREAVASAISRLYDLGYFRRIEVRREEGQLIFVFEERPFVQEVVRVGIDELSKEKVDGAVKIRSGAFLDPQAVRDTRSALDALYRDEGFSRTDVMVRSEPLADDGDVRVVVEARETGKVRVLEVRLQGHAHFTDDELLGRLETAPPSALGLFNGRGTWNRDAAERDRYRIEAAYLEQGFLKVQVEGPAVTFTPDGRAVVVEYRVHEGLQYSLRRIEYAGDLFYRRATLRDWLDVPDGEPLNRLKLDEGIRTTTDAYAEYGFAFARVEPDFTFDDNSREVDVTVRITRGPLVYVRRIEVVGNTKSRDKVVRRELQIAEGELFSGRAVRNSRERVYALGFFEAVTFETEAVADDELDIRIRVTERPTGTASAGVGYSSLDSFVGNLKLNFGNLAGYGIRLDLQTEFGKLRQTFNVSFTDPYFLDSPFSFGVDLFHSRQEYFSSVGGYQAYKQTNTGGRLSFGYKVAIYNRVFLSLRDELTEFDGLQLSSNRFFTGGETRSLTLTWRRDSRNHPYDPTRGNLFLASAESAGQFLGGDHTFTKYRLLVQHFYSFARDYLTLAGRVEGGLATTQGDRVPFAERYFLGGIQTLRGYDWRTVGPALRVPTSTRDPFTGVSRVFTGGNKQVLLSAELIYPILPPAGIKGVFFIDAGNTWLEEADWFDSGLRLGYGFGIRWFSPIGPLRFEWGFPIDRRPNERSRVFEFSIGSYF